NPDGAPALEKEIEVPEGADATVAAHLSADSKPEWTAFVNDVSPVGAGQARLTVRHVAAAPAVDVGAGGQPVLTGLENPKEQTTEVDAGTVNADVVLAGTDTVAIGPADLTLQEGTSTVVYAWGSAEDDNLALKTQTFSGTASAPKGVHAGGNGAAVDPGSPGSWPGWAAAAGAVTVTSVLVARRVAGRRACAAPVAGRGGGDRRRSGRHPRPGVRNAGDGRAPGRLRAVGPRARHRRGHRSGRGGGPGGRHQPPGRSPTADPGAARRTRRPD